MEREIANLEGQFKLVEQSYVLTRAEN
jgi:hypothetical protein